MVREPPSEPRFAGKPVPTPATPDDDGAAAVELTARLREFADGTVGGALVLEALSQSRLLVPVVAVLDESEIGPDDMRREKQSSMATVLVRRGEGGQALLAFSSIEALTRWRADARPVPLAAPLAARAAVDEGADTLLIDVAGPTPFAVTDDELLLVAAVSRAPGDPCEDPVVLATMRRRLGAEPRVRSAALLPGAPATLTLGVDTLGVDDGDQSWIGQLVEQIAADGVVRRLLPGGLRVRHVLASDLSDTPGAVPLTTRGF